MNYCLYEFMLKEINDKNKNLNFDLSQKLIIGGVLIRAGGSDVFLKINNRGGTIIRYSRVENKGLRKVSQPG